MDIGCNKTNKIHRNVRMMDLDGIVYVIENANDQLTKVNGAG